MVLKINEEDLDCWITIRPLCFLIQLVVSISKHIFVDDQIFPLDLAAYSS